MKASSEFRDSWYAAAAAGLAYLSTYSFFFNFDGVACAIAVDLGDLRHLVHGNHIAYGICGWAFDRLWRVFGYSGPGIVPLQVASSLLGAGAAGVFHRTCRDLGLSRLISLAATGGLAFSYAFWFWSLEAQVYMLGALFLALAVKEALAPQPRPARLGALNGLAVLGHVEHVMFVPAALFLLRRGRPRYAAALAATVLAAYAAAALLIIQPRSVDDWRLWLLGSAALTPDRSFHWHGAYSWTSLSAWAKTTLHILTGLGSGPGGAGLALAGLAAAGWGAKAMGPRAKALALWLSCYAVLIISWEPSTIVYRITDLIALWLLIAFGAQSVPGRAGGAGLAGLALVLTAFNWRQSISRAADPLANEAYQESLWIGRVTPPEAWVAVSSIDHVYLPYFAGRKPLPLGDPRETLRRLGGPEPVFISGRSLAAADWAALLKGRSLKEHARQGDWILFRIGGVSP